LFILEKPAKEFHGWYDQFHKRRPETMKHIPSDKYNVAWFTLAECVSRGEKVRAMSLYRLLAHSIEDQAFISQLKGDLLRAFQDKDSIELYQEAAELYEKDNRLLEAVAVYEHLILLEPTRDRYLKSLIKLYKQLSISSKVATFLERLFDYALEQYNSDDARDALNQLDNIEDAAEHINLHERFIRLLLKQKEPSKELIIKHGKKVIDALITADETSLQKFLTTVDAMNGDCYLELCKYLEDSQK